MAVAIDKDIAKLVKALKSNRFDRVEYAPDGESAVKIVLDIVPTGATVGMAGSTSIRQLGLAGRLRERGNSVLDITAPSQTPMLQVQKQSVSCDVLLTSTNAVTLDGKLVNIDGTGNRVAGMIFGPGQVIFIVGANKIVNNLDEAIDRIKNVIAPYHSKTKGGRTPCVTLGKCTDCNSPDRICNITTIIEKKPTSTPMTIIIVGEDLGLGWDPSWPEERKERIASVYRETRKGSPVPRSQ